MSCEEHEWYLATGHHNMVFLCTMKRPQDHRNGASGKNGLIPLCESHCYGTIHKTKARLRGFTDTIPVAWKNTISCEELCPKHSSNRGSKFPDCVNSVIRVLSLGLLYCNFSDINITCPEKMPPLLAVLSWVLCFELGSLF